MCIQLFLFVKCLLADNCKKLGLVFDDVVGIIEVINCKDVKVQVCMLCVLRMDIFAHLSTLV